MQLDAGVQLRSSFVYGTSRPWKWSMSRGAPLSSHKVDLSMVQSCPGHMSYTVVVSEWGYKLENLGAMARVSSRYLVGPTVAHQGPNKCRSTSTSGATCCSTPCPSTPIPLTLALPLAPGDTGGPWQSTHRHRWQVVCVDRPVLV